MDVVYKIGLMVNPKMLNDRVLRFNVCKIQAKVVNLRVELSFTNLIITNFYV